MRRPEVRDGEPSQVSARGFDRGRDLTAALKDFSGYPGASADG
jgi:hypothetical protein